MDVVVVESPSKAKTINKYLGKDYMVFASFGHVRDLPPKDGSVDPEDAFAMKWEVSGQADKRIKEIAAAVKQADRLFLATDPDREGEAISWHLQEELKRRRVLKDVEIKRVVFNQITKSAVQEAFREPRELNNELVDAYLARRALDYLVGFTLSPVLWRKLPGSKSAGRVQSVALRLICEREAEIEIFKAQEYWTIDVDVKNESGAVFQAALTHLDGNKLAKFDLPNETAATGAASILENAKNFTIGAIERKQTRRNPYAPFITSTLQQEASRKLGFSNAHTMRVAQKLYEGIEIDGETTGLITYMRTDGTDLAPEAINQIRSTIHSSFGERYIPDSPRIFKTKAKNAQEAHEAIRPTDSARVPESLRERLGKDEYRLYELIWKRTMACQMASAIIDQTGVNIVVDQGAAQLRANGSVIVFDGFLRLYQESKDDGKDDDGDRRLPQMSEGEVLERQKVAPEQHFTQPPPRYTEASLVKRMEELGIGRPSTYASIIQVLQDRDYVTLEKKRFTPASRGRVVVAFLVNFFKRYVEYDFTANLEDQLDNVSNGSLDYKVVLSDFWTDFKAAVDDTKELRITNVIDALDETLAAHFFPEKEDGSNPRACPTCANGILGLRLGKSGGFIGCSNYPECKQTRPLTVSDGVDGQIGDSRLLGIDPETEQSVFIKKGPYGWYVQLGEEAKPKRTSLPKGEKADEIELDRALALLSLPRLLGVHEDEEVTAGIGRYGPFVKKGKTYKSIPVDESVLEIGINRAVTLLAEAKPGARAGKEIGKHPEDSEPITLHDGKYGPYVKHGKLNASLPRGDNPDEITVEKAVELLIAQAERKAAKSGKKAPAKKAPAKKKTPAKKKAAAKKEA